MRTLIIAAVAAAITLTASTASATGLTANQVRAIVRQESAKILNKSGIRTPIRYAFIESDGRVLPRLSNGIEQGDVRVERFLDDAGSREDISYCINIPSHGAQVTADAHNFSNSDLNGDTFGSGVAFVVVAPDSLDCKVLIVLTSTDDTDGFPDGVAMPFYVLLY